jgi:3',5'-nucleoside bisphosphate phosphatase
MKEFLADMHIHTVLSPCGDLEMTPQNIVDAALKKGLSMIAITDHNSTRMCRIISEYAATKGLAVIAGAEVNTSEEVHCLAYFGNWEQVVLFQIFLDEHLLDLQNKPSIFGDQVVVDIDENILYTEKRSLITGLNASIDKVESFVHSLDGLFIPAHIYRRQNGIIHQLGMLPESLNYDALELTPGSYSDEYLRKNKLEDNMSFIFDSDAHFIDQIGKFSTRLMMKSPEFNELKLALRNSEGRSVIGLKRK